MTANRIGSNLLLRTRHEPCAIKQVRPKLSVLWSKVVGVGYRLLSACKFSQTQTDSVTSSGNRVCSAKTDFRGNSFLSLFSNLRLLPCPLNLEEIKVE